MKHNRPSKTMEGKKGDFRRFSFNNPMRQGNLGESLEGAPPRMYCFADEDMESSCERNKGASSGLRGQKKTGRRGGVLGVVATCGYKGASLPATRTH